MLKIGLTGGIGSGKTTVSDTFAELGVAVIDTDIIAREVLTNDAELLKQLRAEFGESIIKNKQLDRSKLRELAFSSENNKQLLDSIMHPAILKETQQQIATLELQKNQYNYCIIVVPLLFETNFHKLVDRTLVVTAPLENKFKWLKKRSNLDKQQAEKIMQAQTSDSEKIKIADDIIENNADLESLKNKTRSMHDFYLSLVS